MIMYFTFTINGQYYEIYFGDVFSYDDETNTMTLMDGVTTYIVQRTEINIIIKD
jgi:hypothetical protein